MVWAGRMGPFPPPFDSGLSMRLQQEQQAAAMQRVAPFAHSKFLMTLTN